MLEQLLGELELVGLGRHVECRVSALALLHVEVGSVLEENFHGVQEPHPDGDV